jgi:hypothetical protein
MRFDGDWADQRIIRISCDGCLVTAANSLI